MRIKILCFIKIFVYIGPSHISLMLNPIPKPPKIPEKTFAVIVVKAAATARTGTAAPASAASPTKLPVRYMVFPRSTPLHAKDFTRDIEFLQNSVPHSNIFTLLISSCKFSSNFVTTNS